MIQLEIPNLDSQNRLFMTWVPIRVRVRQTNVAPDAPDIALTFRNGGATGRFWFAPARANSGNDEIALTIPGDGTPAEFWMAGEFGQPSESFGDAALEVAMNGQTLGAIPAMIRVRKNANTLTEAERDRFLAAFGTLNGQGTGRFGDLRAMHTRDSSPQAHGGSAFPHWHRAYMLDLERELQAIDPEVTLPYWRFDAPAPNVFTSEFMGVNSGTGFAGFAAGHAFDNWATDGSTGIFRTMNFQPDEAPPPIAFPDGTWVMNDEATTLGLGGNDNDFGPFQADYESNPHGFAHVSFDGHIGSVPTAARDPLFFMLHCNVDRLWAKWQWIHDRHDRNTPQTYVNGNRDGHRLDDTMWPWNGVTGGTRPPTAPGGGLQDSVVTDLPGGSPTVAQMVDYMNVTGALETGTGGDIGFCYDDVPFEIESGAGA